MTVPLVEVETLPELLTTSAVRNADRLAVRAPWQGNLERVTFREQLERAAGVAERLASDVDRGDFVLIGGRNSIAWVSAFFGTLLRGAIPVPLDTEMPSDALASILAELRPRAVVGDDEFLGRIDGAGGTRIRLDDLHDWPPSAEVPPLSPPPAPDDLAIMLYTGGTTGVPKGVMLSHRNVIAGANAAIDAAGLRDDDALFVVLPLFHVFPLVVGCLTPWAAGIPVELEYRLTRIADRAAETPPTIVLAVPALLEALLRTIERNARGGLKGTYFNAAARLNALSVRTTGVNLGRILFRPIQQALGGRLRYLVSGGARLDPAVHRRLIALGLPTIQGYGLSEAAPVVAVQRFHDREFWWRGRRYWRRIGSVGTQLLGVAVTIEPIEELDPGEGELVVRAPNVMLGYYQRPAETAARMRDGALYTGDVARIDRDGDIWITGRASLVISMPNGKQVNLETMEAELTGAPELAQVRLVVEQEPTWKLVAVTFPAVDTLEAGATDAESLQRLVREAFRRQSRGFPSWLRVDEIRLVDKPLPVTRLGKVRRIDLPAGPFDFDRWRAEAERIASPAQG